MIRRLPLFILCAAMLSSSLTFAQATSEKKQDSKESAAKEKDTTEEKAEEELTPEKQLQNLLTKGQLQKAEKLADELDQDGKLPAKVRSQLAQAYARKRNYGGAATQYEKLLRAELEKENFEVSAIVSGVSMLRVYLPRADRADDVLPLVDEAIEVVATKADESKASANLKALMQLRLTKSYSLRVAGKTDEADAILRSDYDLAKGLYEKDQNTTGASLYSSSMRNLMPTLKDDSARRELLATHQDFASALAEEGNVEMATVFVQASLSEISRTARTDPEMGEEMIAGLRKFMEHHSENDAINDRISRYERSIDSYESRIESAKKLLAMIGQPAPPIATDVNWVGSDGPVDTKGKVVLLDFWALWCGPCIATFPHLKHLSEEYGDHGFQVVGVTRYYNYTWDDEADRPKSGDRSADPNPEVENEVLKKFLAGHQLAHPTMVVSKDSTMHKDFGVSGIPHVALLDQDGTVQLVKVGSGPDNAAAIEAKIRELLGLDEEPESSVGE